MGSAQAPASALVIFDCDGVLIDSEILVCRIVAEELTALGIPSDTADIIQRFAGRPDGDMQRELMQQWGRPLPETFAQRVTERTARAYATELRPVPGVLPMLEALRLPRCVASSSAPDKLALGLRSVGLYERFAPNIISAAQVAHGKPAPDVFLFAAGWMRTSPLGCVVVEDSVPGVLAARRAGMRVFGFSGASHGSVQQEGRLLEAGAERTFQDLRQLPELLDPDCT